MNEITDVKPQKAPGRFNIFVNGKFSFAVSDLALVKNKLKIGKQISDQETNSLKADDTFSRHYDNALKFLSFRPRSRKEVETRLKKKGVDTNESNLILEKLDGLKLLDDEEFSKWWITQRKTFRPKGWRIIKIELLQKGISREIIDSLAPEEKEDQEALRILEKKWSSWHRLDKTSRREKAARFLQSRGYDWEITKKAIDQLASGDIK